MSQDDHNRYSPWLRWLLGIVLILFIIFVVADLEEGKKIWGLIGEIKLKWLIVACCLQILTFYQKGAVWWFALKKLGIKVNMNRMARLGLAKFFIDQSLPSAGISGLVLLHKIFQKQNIDKDKVLAVLITNIISFYIGYAAVLLLALLLGGITGILNFSILIPALIFEAILMILIFLLYRYIRTDVKDDDLLLRWPWLKRKIKPLLMALPQLRSHKILPIQAAFFQMMVFIVDAATFWILLYAIAVSVSPFQVFAAYGLSSVARTLSIIPGGLGIFEAAAIGMMSLADIPISGALAATLLFRGFSFWLPLLPGFLVFRWEIKTVKT